MRLRAAAVPADGRVDERELREGEPATHGSAMGRLPQGDLRGVLRGGEARLQEGEGGAVARSPDDIWAGDVGELAVADGELSGYVLTFGTFYQNLVNSVINTFDTLAQDILRTQLSVARHMYYMHFAHAF